jgi:ATP-binding cassette, subfamily C, bacterial
MKPEPVPAHRDALRELGRGAAAAGFVGFFVNLLHLALPLYTIQIFDRVISSGSYDTLMALTVLATIVFLFQAVLDFLRHRIFGILSDRVATRLGEPVLAASVESTVRNGPSRASGALRDLGEIRSFIAGGTIGLPMDLLAAPLFLLVLFLLHPLYGTVALIGAVLLTLAAVATEVLVRRPAALASAAAAQGQASTAAALRNAEAIVAMGMLPAVARRWRGSQARTLERMEASRSRAKGLGAAAKALRIGLQIAVICVGATLVIERAASPGTIIAAAVLTARLLLPFEQLIEGWRQWVEALGAFDRLRDVLASGATTRSAVPIPIEHGRLELDRVSFVPPGEDRPLVRNVSLRLESGALLGIIGPSGAGKSTLARLVVGIWAPTAGGIYLDGQSTFLHERSSFGEAVGYLPQDPLLFDATVADNIARFRDADMTEVIAAARLAGVHELIGALPQGYATPLSESGARLSGGQRQRIALARALYGRPKLLVLDEPNSNLDAEGEAALVTAIEAARQGGATVVVIAQRMSILNRADRLLVLKDGAVARFGPREEVLAALGPLRRSGHPPSPAALPAKEMPS